MQKYSFNYTISSDDRINTDANQIYYDIDFGGLQSPYDNFQIEVVNCVLNGSVEELNGYLILTCQGLHDDGIFCRKVLNANECIMCTIPTNIDTLMSSGGISFRANNCRMVKRIKFRFLSPSFDPVIDGTDINLSGAETKWLLTLRMTPIID